MYHAEVARVFKRAPPGNDNGKGNTIPKPLPVAGDPKAKDSKPVATMDKPVDDAKALSESAAGLTAKANSTPTPESVSAAVQANKAAAKSLRAAGKATALSCTGSEADKQTILDQYEEVALVHDKNIGDLSKLKTVEKGDDMYAYRGGKIVYSHLFKGARSGQPGAGGMAHEGMSSGAAHMAGVPRTKEGEPLREATVRSAVHDHMSGWQSSEYGKLPDAKASAVILERAVAGKKMSMNNLVDDFDLSAGKAKSLIESRKKALEPFGNSGPTQTQAQRIDAYLKQPTAGYMRR